MADEDRTADRSSVRAGAEALQRAIEEVSNLTFEDHPDARERLVSLLNQVSQNFSDIGDRIGGDRSREADRDTAAEDVAKRDEAGKAVDARRARR